ncbi:hypothetical protein BAE44_0017857, partial [Dichanthelium oligosanthes]
IRLAWSRPGRWRGCVDERDVPDDGQKGTWPHCYRQPIDVLSAVPSPTVSTLMAASPSLTKFGMQRLPQGYNVLLRRWNSHHGLYVESRKEYG